MKKAKRALALALVFALVASFCVTGAAAVDEPVPGYSDTYVQNGGAVTTEDDVIVSKTAEYVGKNEYEITLEVKVPGNVTAPGSSADVVLVIDRSNSMNDDRKLESAKNAAKAFANTLLADSVTADVQLAVVSYNRTADIECGLTDSGSQVEKAVDGIWADGGMNGGTNIQAGIHEAREILSSSTADKKVIVVLSDGEPTYSYDVSTAAAGSVEHHSFIVTWHNFGDFYDIQFSYDNIVGDGTDYDSLDYAEVYAYCEECKGQVSENVQIYENHGGPTIAEADFAREDGYEVYGLYLGEPNENAKYTMEGVADTGKYEQASGESLSGLLQDIAGDVTETTAGAVTDPMGDKITLGDVRDLADDGVTATGSGLTWNPTNGKTNQDGSTTYTVTYPITVDGEALTKSGWVDANGTTTFSYKVNDEYKTVDFNVPQVWGEKVETETPQNVYVYVQVVNDDESPLTDEQISQIRGWGLTTLNDSGYYTIGVMPNITLPVASADYSNGLTQAEINAVATSENLSTIEKHSDNEGFIIDEKIDWVKLHTDGGADGYSTPGEKYYVDSSTSCWHLNGQITLTELEQELVDVVYQDGVNNSAFPAQTYKAYPGTATPQFTGTPEREGYTFTGWSPALMETVSENGDTYTAQWIRNAGNITIEVYLDGEKVTLTDDTHLKNYISNLTDDAGTPTFEYNVEDGVIKGTYNYEQFDSADIVLTPNDDYALQGIDGTFIQGSQAWQGITQSDDGWKIDNVKGGSTLKVYLNTKYSVEYVVTGSETIKAPTDDAVYVTGAGVTSDNSNQPVTGQDGEQRSWMNDGLTTKFTIEDVPEGATGWTDEANDSQTAGTEITVSTAVTNGLDDNSDHIFTFTATANEYTVTYHANTSADDPTLYTDSNTVTHGESYTVLGNTNDYFQYTNTGYTFAGWATSATGGVAYSAGSNITVTEDVDLYAVWTAITGTLTVTKTVEGLEGNDTLPGNFSITVTGPDSFSRTLTLDGTTPVDGVYTWEIIDAPYGEYTITETNTTVSGYALQESSVKEATASIKDENGDTAELKNVYIKDEPGLGVEKTVYSVNGSASIPSEVKVGDVIVYQIVVKNTGNVLLEKISVTDTLGDQTLTVYTDADCKTKATAFDLDVNETKELYATYTVQAADAGTKLTNTATAEDEDGTEDSGEVTVNVTPQYKVDVVYHYDTVDGTTFAPPSGTQTVFIYDAGEDWNIGTVPEKVSNNGENYIFDESRSDSTSGTNISENVTVNLVYVKDELDDEDDTETGGDDIPDYKQAVIKYVADPAGSGTVSNEIDVVTLDEDENGEYKDNVKANSTATAGEGYVFTSWTGPEDYTSDEAQLSHTFTAEGGRIYVFTAHFRAGTTSASVDKQLVSYERDGETVSEIPEGFKALVGDVLNYEISVKNTGEVALNTTVTDSITGEGTLTINAGEGYTVEDGKIIISGLAPEGTVTITASYTVVAADAGKTITNTATVDLPGGEPGDDPTGEEEVTVDDYSVTITPADIVAYTGGDGYSAVVGEDNQYINDSTSGLPEPGYHVVLSDAVVDWLNDNGVAAGDGSESEAANLEDVLSFTYDDGTNKRNWSLRYVGVYSYNASGSPSAYVYSIVTETAGAPSVSLKYFDDLNEDGVAGVDEVITSDDILMSADQVNHTYKMTIEGGGLDQSQVKAVLKAGGKSLTTDIDIGIGELTVLSTTNEETTNSIAGNAAGVDSGVITAVGNDSITYYVNESGVSFNDEDLVSRVQLLIDEVTNETSGEFETAMAEAAFNAISADLRNAEYEMCYMDLVDTENGNAKVTFSGGELSIYWPLPDGASASDSFYIVHFTELDREHDAVGTDVLDTTNKDVIAGEVMRIGGEYYVTFDVGSFSPFVLVYGDEGGGRPIIPVPDPDDGDDEEEEFVPKWLNIDDHYAYIIGYEDGTVRPQGNITRAEVATIFFRLLTDEVREEYWSTESGYSDVSSSDWYNNAISTLSNLGVITGYEDGTFRPNASISRAEFVTIATRFFDYTAEYEGTFSDVSYSSWYADFVQAAVDMGLVNGYENGTFRPNASITRAEAVAIVNRVLLRRPDADHLLPWSVMNTFSDNVLESAWYYEDIQEATNSHDYEWLKSGVEDWTEKLPERDWAALEREWSSAYDAPGGEVTG